MYYKDLLLIELQYNFTELTFLYLVGKRVFEDVFLSVLDYTDVI